MNPERDVIGPPPDPPDEVPKSKKGVYIVLVCIGIIAAAVLGRIVGGDRESDAPVKKTTTYTKPIAQTLPGEKKITSTEQEKVVFFSTLAAADKVAIFAPGSEDRPEAGPPAETAFDSGLESESSPFSSSSTGKKDPIQWSSEEVPDHSILSKEAIHAGMEETVHEEGSTVATSLETTTAATNEAFSPSVKKMVPIAAYSASEASEFGMSTAGYEDNIAEKSSESTAVTTEKADEEADVYAAEKRAENGESRALPPMISCLENAENSTKPIAQIISNQKKIASTEEEKVVFLSTPAAADKVAIPAPGRVDMPEPASTAETAPDSGLESESSPFSSTSAGKKDPIQWSSEEVPDHSILSKEAIHAGMEETVHEEGVTVATPLETKLARSTEISKPSMPTTGSAEDIVGKPIESSAGTSRTTGEEAEVSAAEERAETEKSRGQLSRISGLETAENSSRSILRHASPANDVVEKSDNKDSLTSAGIGGEKEIIASPDSEERNVRQSTADGGHAPYYTVRKGDCLWKIAEKNGDPYGWIKIFQANRDKIDDQDLIYPNQKLKIPNN